MTEFNVRAENPDGTIDTLALVQGRGLFESGSKYLLELSVTRPELNNASLVQGQSEIYVEDVSGTVEDSGILGDIDRQGSFPTLVVDSWEARGQTAEKKVGTNADSGSTVGQEVYTATQGSTIVTDAIGNVDMWSQGTINTSAAPDDPISVEYNNASYGMKLREIEEELLRWIRFDSTTKGAVDYLAKSDFTDKTTTTVSPANQNMEEMSIRRQEFGGRKTHVRVLGLGSGDSQIAVEKAISSYTAGDPKFFLEIARKYKSGKDKQAVQNTLTRIANNLIDDIENPHVTVECTNLRKPDVGDVRLYDQYNIQKSAENFNQDLYVLKYEKFYGSVVTYNVFFSNYLNVPDNEETREKKDRLRSIGSYQKANGGSVDNIQSGGGNRSPVGPNDNWEMTVPYPDDVIHEDFVELKIKGRPYRAFSAGAANGGGTTQSTTSTGGRDQGTSSDATTAGSSFNGSSTWTTVNDFSFTDDPESMFVAFRINNQATSATTWEFRIYNRTNGTVLGGVGSTGKIYRTGSSSITHSAFMIGQRGGNVAGDDLELQIRSADGNQGAVTSWVYMVPEHEHDVSITFPDHTHAPDPGIIDFNGTEASPALYPSGIDVIVNGTEVATNVGGDGTTEFEVTVDISGELTPGFNEIEITSDELGHIECASRGRVFVSGQGR